MKVGVEMMPLIFSKKLNVTGVTIASPQVDAASQCGGRLELFLR